MHVEDCNATVRLDRNELRIIGLAMKRSLFRSIEDHYNCLQRDEDGEQLFFEQEKVELRLIETFSCLYGEHLNYESLVQRAKKEFQEKREERAKVKKECATGNSTNV